MTLLTRCDMVYAWNYTKGWTIKYYKVHAHTYSYRSNILLCYSCKGAHQFIECFISEEILTKDAQKHLLVKDNH